MSNTSNSGNCRPRSKVVTKVLINFQRIILTFWIGGMWAVGYLVVPVLFSQLPTPQMAGSLAGSLFLLLSWSGLISALMLTLIYFYINSEKWRFLVLFLITVFIGLNLFYLTPEIASLREIAGDALQKGTELYSRFAILHGIASGLYLLISLSGLLLVVRQPDQDT